MNARNNASLLTAARGGIAITFITLELWIVLGVTTPGASPVGQVVLAVSGPVVAVLLGAHTYRTGRDGGAR